MYLSFHPLRCCFLAHGRLWRSGTNKTEKNNGSIITVQAIENRGVCFLPFPPVLLCACFIFGCDTGTIRIFSSASAPIDCQLSLHIASSTFARGSFNVKSIIGCSNKKAFPSCRQRDPCLKEVCEKKYHPPEYIRPETCGMKFGRKELIIKRPSAARSCEKEMETRSCGSIFRFVAVAIDRNFTNKTVNKAALAVQKSFQTPVIGTSFAD